jgi:ABC-type multidrug transport system ATPase subunit
MADGPGGAGHAGNRAEATDFVIDGDTRLLAARNEVHDAEASDDGMRMAEAYMALNDAGEHDAEARAQSLILGLGFKVSELHNPVNSFSGGWRMRLQLARALMCPSDILLLDEPTNHLDLDALVWLEAWLKRYPGTLVMISHDREFLDAITGVTLHIDNAKLVRYGGNYSKFEDMRAEQMLLQQATMAKQAEKIAHLQSFINRFKAKASKAKQAQSRVKALDRMEKIAPVLADAEFSFEFQEPQNLPNPMLSMVDTTIGYPPPEDAPAGTPPTVIVRGINRSVMAGQRIGILGANGQGKSTLVKTIARDTPFTREALASPARSTAPAAAAPGRRRAAMATWRCAAGHSFDIAAHGAAYLLPVQNKRSRDPGDSKEMVAARRRFLECRALPADRRRGQPRRCWPICRRRTASCLDAGCGEGYYLRQLAAAAAERRGADAGAARPGHLEVGGPGRRQTGQPRPNWIVGSNANLPVLPGTLDRVLCMFGFPGLSRIRPRPQTRRRAAAGRRRPEHLRELREIIYPTLKPERPPHDGARRLHPGQRNLRYPLEIGQETDRRPAGDDAAPLPRHRRRPRQGRGADRADGDGGRADRTLTRCRMQYICVSTSLHRRCRRKSASGC